MNSKNKCKYKWIEQNIFNFNVRDAVFYFFIYITFPVVTTFLNLEFNIKDSIDRTYCYVAIIINAMGCIYDAVNRFTEKTIVKLKLVIIMIILSIVSMYCAIQILIFLIARSYYTVDGVLYIFIIAMVIATFDFGSSIVHRIMKEQSSSDYFEKLKQISDIFDKHLNKYNSKASYLASNSHDDDQNHIFG